MYAEVAQLVTLPGIAMIIIYIMRLVKFPSTLPLFLCLLFVCENSYCLTSHFNNLSKGSLGNLTLDDIVTRYRYYNKLGRYKRSYSSERNVEVMVVTDHSMVQYHGNSLRQYVLTLMATVALIYRDPSIGNYISISVVKLKILTQIETKDIIHSPAAQTLKHFCKWQHSFRTNNNLKYDTAILLTRRNLCKKNESCDTLGLAQSGRICDPSLSCGIVEDNGLAAAFTIAHELGHVLGIPHDDDIRCKDINGPKAQQFHIMARMLNYDSNPWTWSKCSEYFLTTFLDAGNGECLLDREDSNFLDEISNFINNNPQPGEIFSENYQCELVFGEKSKICPYMPPCKRLWCTVDSPSGGCKTQHMPWADGTPCGRRNGYKCKKGRCVMTKDKIELPVNGDWGPWSNYSDCSRTCGGGIAQATRECNNPRPKHGGKYCTGLRVKYKSCNTHECPAGTIDFREYQCSQFNSQSFGIEGLSSNITWKPRYTGIKEEDRCKLYCNVVGSVSYALLKQKVIDGTLCSPDSHDICVNGECMQAGCDHILGSKTKPDSCGVCGGDNSTCHVVVGNLDKVQVHYGYNSITVIPKGAANIEIIQPNSSPKDRNYLAIKSDDGNYLLNGDMIVSSSKKTIQYGGTIIEYSGSNQEVERINTSKPIHRPMYVELLSAAENSYPKVRYRYSSARPILSVNKKCARKSCLYVWKTSEWSDCSKNCDEGEEIRTVFCHLLNKKFITKRRKYHRYGSNLFCDEKSKPKATRSCNLGSCKGNAFWRPGPWSNCSSSCGPGKQHRRVPCLTRTGRKIPRRFCNLRNRPQRKRKCDLGKCAK